jgi:hypothetical protein
MVRSSEQPHTDSRPGGGVAGCVVSSGRRTPVGGDPRGEGTAAAGGCSGAGNKKRDKQQDSLGQAGARRTEEKKLCVLAGWRQQGEIEQTQPDVARGLDGFFGRRGPARSQLGGHQKRPLSAPSSARRDPSPRRGAGQRRRDQALAARGKQSYARLFRLAWARLPQSDPAQHGPARPLPITQSHAPTRTDTALESSTASAASCCRPRLSCSCSGTALAKQQQHLLMCSLLLLLHGGGRSCVERAPLSTTPPQQCLAVPPPRPRPSRPLALPELPRTVDQRWRRLSRAAGLR